MKVFGRTISGKINWSTVAKNKIRQWGLDNPNCQFYIQFYRMPEGGREYARVYYFAAVVGTLMEYAGKEGQILNEKEAHEIVKNEMGVDSTKDLEDMDYWRFILKGREWVMSFFNTFIPAPKNFDW